MYNTVKRQNDNRNFPLSRANHVDTFRMANIKVFHSPPYHGLVLFNCIKILPPRW